MVSIAPAHHHCLANIVNWAWVSCCFQLSFCIVGCRFYGTLSLTVGIEFLREDGGGGGEVGRAKAPPPCCSLSLIENKAGASHASLGTIAHTKYAMILKVPY